MQCLVWENTSALARCMEDGGPRLFCLFCLADKNGGEIAQDLQVFQDGADPTVRICDEAGLNIEAL